MQDNIDYANKLIDEQILDEQQDEDIEEVTNEIVEINNKSSDVSTSTTFMPNVMDNGLENTLQTAQDKILTQASEKINKKNNVDKKAKRLSKLVDDKFEVDAATKDVEIEEQQTNNKARKKELKNRLIVLKNEAKRIRKEQKNLNKVQKMEHSKAKKDALWGTYGKALTELGYDYVPNRVTLSILMWLLGTKAFITGLGKIGDALVVSLKWVLVISGILIILLSIPVTKSWLLGLLGFIA